jgi:anthranilate phosphoribosyltransferase
VLGVYAAEMVPLMADAMAHLNVRRGFVVHGAGGLDEISLSGETEIAEVENGAVRLWSFRPEDAGLKPAPVSALAGGDALENAAILQSIFAGETGPRRDVVLVNAAAALIAAGLAADFLEGVARAAHAIDSGGAELTLAALVDFGEMTRCS